MPATVTVIPDRGASAEPSIAATSSPPSRRRRAPARRLTDALALVLLLADEEDERRFRRAAVRWASRYTREVPGVEPAEAQAVLGLTVMLGGRRVQAACALGQLLGEISCPRPNSCSYRCLVLAESGDDLGVHWAEILVSGRLPAGTGAPQRSSRSALTLIPAGPTLRPCAVPGLRGCRHFGPTPVPVPVDWLLAGSAVGAMIRTSTALPTRRHEGRRTRPAWNRHDPDLLMTYMADECSYQESFGSELEGADYVGREAVREGFAAFFERYPDGRFVDSEIRAFEPERAAAVWTFAASRLDGGRSRVRGCDLFEFDGDKVSRKNAFRKQQ